MTERRLPIEGSDPLLAKLLRHPRDFFDLSDVAEVGEALKLVEADREQRPSVPVIDPMPFADTGHFVQELIRVIRHQGAPRRD